MGRPMDYGPAAGIYAAHRWAIDAKRDAILDIVAGAGSEATVLDLGCGTGDYLVAAHERFPGARFMGCDLSPEMLEHARARCPWAEIHQADADGELPFPSASVDVLFSVDVFHHLRDPSNALREASRLLRRHGRLCVITDSEEDLRARTLTELFPESLEINLERYPHMEDLCETAVTLGFGLVSRRTLQAYLDLDPRLLQALEAKALSELRLISPAQHAQGMERARALGARQGRWLSQTTALVWARE